MKEFITPNDDGIRAESDSLSIQNAVDEAVRSDIRCVLIPRINERRGEALWEIDRAIILPSNIEIVLDNCYLRQSDGSMDNVFRNFEDDAVRCTLAEEQENIVIRGVGNAVIDGGLHNGLTQQNSGKDHTGGIVPGKAGDKLLADCLFFTGVFHQIQNFGYCGFFIGAGDLHPQQTSPVYTAADD